MFLKRKWQGNYHIHRFFWDFWKVICLSEWYLPRWKDTSKFLRLSLTRHQLLLFCWYREHLWKNLGSEWKEFTVSKKPPGTTVSWKAWGSQETTLKHGERKELCYGKLIMRMLGLHTRGWVDLMIVQGNVCSCLNSGTMEGSFKSQMPTIKGASQVSDPFYRWVNRCIWMPWHPDLLYWISDLLITEPNG